ncbi:MAG: hypothetical protein K6G85_03890 [Eubacterium sp.]|nr:hypothetical protein [Eubacterium sp.]
MFKVNEDIIRESIYKYGKQMQTVVCMEELAELTQALSKQLRGSGNEENLIEEIADVYICLKMISVMYFVNEKVIEESIKNKQMRTHKRIEGEE